MSHPNKENKNGDFPTKVTALASCLQRHEFFRVVKAVLPVTLSAQENLQTLRSGAGKAWSLYISKALEPPEPFNIPWSQ